MAFFKQFTNVVISCSVWAAVKVTRSLEVLCCTVGGRIAVSQIPCSTKTIVVDVPVETVQKLNIKAGDVRCIQSAEEPPAKKSGAKRGKKIK